MREECPERDLAAVPLKNKLHTSTVHTPVFLAVSMMSCSQAPLGFHPSQQSSRPTALQPRSCAACARAASVLAEASLVARRQADAVGAERLEEQRKALLDRAR